MKYRLEWHSEAVLAIDWASGIGDCYVRAICYTTDRDKFIKAHHRSEWTEFTEPMSIDQVRDFVVKNWPMLGGVRDCVGLTLADESRKVLFEKPVLIKTL